MVAVFAVAWPKGRSYILCCCSPGCATGPGYPGKSLPAFCVLVFLSELNSVGVRCVRDGSIYLGATCLFTVAVELATGRGEEGGGAGIRRPELALVIHAKATPSVTSPHLLCPSLPLHFAVALRGLSLSHLLEEETEKNVLPHTLKHEKKKSYGIWVWRGQATVYFMDFIMWLKRGI